MTSEPLAARKCALRRTMIELRSHVDLPRAQAAAQAVAVHVSRLAQFAAAESVALYVPRPDSGELDSHPLFEIAGRMGKRRFLPRCTESVELEYVGVEDWESLQPGRYGIPEPRGERVPLPGSESLVVCPGVAFDARGGRLGMGRGYFDRTFSARGKDRAFLVGVGYTCQIVENLPQQEHDQAMDALVTEDGLVKLCSGDFSHD